MAYYEEYDYVPMELIARLESETNSEFDPAIWRDDPDMDLTARAMRNLELVLDLTGNLDAPL